MATSEPSEPSRAQLGAGESPPASPTSTAIAARCPWRAKVSKSLAKNKHLAYSRYVQLATVRPDGRPANRTIVFRGFLSDDDDGLTFVTDSRSQKVQEVAANPAAEVAWYLPQTREQYRVYGALTIVDSAHTDTALQKARRRVWSNMSDPGRQQFGWPHPGQPRAQEDPGAWSLPAPPAKEAPLDTFCLVVLRPEELSLFTNRRLRYTRRAPDAEGGAEWAEEEVNP